MTAMSVEMLNGLEKPPANLRIMPLYAQPICLYICPAIQLLPPLKVTPQSIQKIRDWEYGILEFDSPCDDSDIPSLELEADFHLGRGSRLPRCIRFNSRIVFTEVFFTSLLMKL